MIIWMALSMPDGSSSMAAHCRAGYALGDPRTVKSTVKSISTHHCCMAAVHYCRSCLCVCNQRPDLASEEHFTCNCAVRRKAYTVRRRRHMFGHTHISFEFFRMGARAFSGSFSARRFAPGEGLGWYEQPRAAGAQRAVWLQAVLCSGTSSTPVVVASSLCVMSPSQTHGLDSQTD